MNKEVKRGRGEKREERHRRANRQTERAYAKQRKLLLGLNYIMYGVAAPSVTARFTQQQTEGVGGKGKGKGEGGGE